MLPLAFKICFLVDDAGILYVSNREQGEFEYP